MRDYIEATPSTFQAYISYAASLPLFIPGNLEFFDGYVVLLALEISGKHLELNTRTIFFLYMKNAYCFAWRQRFTNNPEFPVRTSLPEMCWTPICIQPTDLKSKCRIFCTIFRPSTSFRDGGINSKEAVASKLPALCWSSFPLHAWVLSVIPAHPFLRNILKCMNRTQEIDESHRFWQTRLRLNLSRLLTLLSTLPVPRALKPNVRPYFTFVGDR